MARKTALEKLRKEAEPKLVDIPDKMVRRLGPGKMLIPTPLQVDAMMRKPPRGRLITIGQVRGTLAREHGANTTCPVCTGIFARIVAEAAEEELAAGKKRVTPYWRFVKDDGSLNEKFPGGTRSQRLLLEAEGHRVVEGKGKKPPKVGDFAKKLVRL